MEERLSPYLNRDPPKTPVSLAKTAGAGVCPGVPALREKETLRSGEAKKNPAKKAGWFIRPEAQWLGFQSRKRGTNETCLFFVLPLSSFRRLNRSMS